MELIKEEKRVEVETEIRVQVDELMRQELKNLKAVSFRAYIMFKYYIHNDHFSLLYSDNFLFVVSRAYCGCQKLCLE